MRALRKAGITEGLLPLFKKFDQMSIKHFLHELKMHEGQLMQECTCGKAGTEHH